MPEVSQRVLETRRRVVGRVAAARSGVETTSNRVAGIMADAFLSQEGREAQVEEVLERARGVIEGELATARRDIQAVLGQAEGHLEELIHVTDEAMAARAAVLGQVLNGTMPNPEEAFLNSYPRRFGNLTDRRLLEEAAQVRIHALAGSDGGAFEERWNALVRELSAQRSPEEREALSERTELYELVDYLDAAQRVAETDLAALSPEGTTDEELVAREIAAAAVNRYETLHAG